MNWYKRAQKQQWSWQRFFRTFGMTTILGLTTITGLNIGQLQQTFARDPEKVVQMAEHYQQNHPQTQPSQIMPETPLGPGLVEKESVPTNMPSVATTSPIPQDVYDMIERHEGKRNTVYLDTKGIPTIGIGYNLTNPDAKSRLEAVGADPNEVLKGSPLTDKQIYTLFKEDVERAKKDAETFLPNFNEQPEVVQNILINMSFNMGLNTLSQFKSFREALLNKDYDAASKSMEKSKWYGQVGNRSKELVSLIKNIIKKSKYFMNWFKKAQFNSFYGSLMSLRPQMAQSAQHIYDQWRMDDIDFGGGICDLIASEIGGIIVSNIENAEIIDGGWEGDDHAYVIASNGTEAYSVDIPHDIYEIGGGYNWKKRTGVQFSPDDIMIEKIEANINELV